VASPRDRAIRQHLEAARRHDLPERVADLGLAVRRP
jgi:hypothetical protein